MNNDRKTPFSFCIASRFDETDKHSPLMAYAYGQQVFYGNMDYARGLLRSIRHQLDDKDEKYYIYKLVKIDDTE